MPWGNASASAVPRALLSAHAGHQAARNDAFQPAWARDITGRPGYWGERPVSVRPSMDDDAPSREHTPAATTLTTGVSHTLDSQA
jgi:hypothetical protein